MQPEQIIFFDVETTGLSRTTDRVVQIAWVLTDRRGNISSKQNLVVKPEGYTIPAQASAIHGIDTQSALRFGKSAFEVLSSFAADAKKADIVVGHNVAFDLGIAGADLRRHAIDLSFNDKVQICTMRSSTGWCRIPKTNGLPGYKFPRLEELHYRLFGHDFEHAHDAMADVLATMRCFYELIRLEVIQLPKPVVTNENVSNHAPNNQAQASAGAGRKRASQNVSGFALTRHVRAACAHCSTIIDVTLNHGETQIACPACHRINRA
ncbi:3'-5' exonuclease [Croceicoccus sp. Ery15]|uniref:3'-5' exonuclease n=1 Tax=Croceicoccus sp. Ery15 TaxID=1703338 RepID=UPI001E3A5471|nr:3'-5' exonuclease [Croceicoccus sp. Ery15]